MVFLGPYIKDREKRNCGIMNKNTLRAQNKKIFDTNQCVQLYLHTWNRSERSELLISNRKGEIRWEK